MRKLSAWRVATGVPAIALVVSATGLLSATSASATVLGCGANVTQNTTLTANVGPCLTPGQDAIRITANSVTLNLNGFSVIGNLAPVPPGTVPISTEGAGIHFMGTRGSTVTNGIVTGFQVGVLLDGGSANVVKKVNAHDNVGDAGSNYGDGIAVDNGSTNNQITNNSVTHNGPYSGISMLLNASQNLVSRNTVMANNVATVNPTTGAAGGNVDMGIRVEGPSATNNNLTYNKVSSSGAQGINVLPVCHDAFLPGGSTCVGDTANSPTLISDNIVTSNGFQRGADGIALFGMGLSNAFQPTGNTVINNTVSGNARDGIRLQSNGGLCVGGQPATECAPFKNTVSNNTITHNLANGINLQIGSNQNQVAQNKVTYNGANGVLVALGAVNNILRGNTGNHNVTFDGFDGNLAPPCDANAWNSNVFNSVNQACVATP